MITIKSARNSLEFWLDEAGTYAQLKQALVDKLEENSAFFCGSSLPAVFYGKILTAAQKRELRSILLNQFGIKRIAFHDEEEPAILSKKPESVSEMPEMGQNAFVLSTLRSGQRIKRDGDIIVVGDVNPGAEVIAGGNIVVFGKLRGLAHAGAMGRKDAIIVTNHLLCKQVRICGKIAIIPEDRLVSGPEMVRLIDDKIVIGMIG